ncbi:unnamed protein product [Prunus brigantina]
MDSLGSMRLQQANEYGLPILLVLELPMQPRLTREIFFDQPTDTMFPTESLNQETILFARYKETTHSRGRFQLTLQRDGNFVFYNTNFPSDSPNSAYWSTQTFDGDSQDFYQRATLEYDGVFRYHVYPKSTSSTVGRWSMAWSTLSYMPSNICTSLLEYTGGGACGFNSLCRRDDEGPSCQCPYGYSHINPDDVLKTGLCFTKL